MKNAVAAVRRYGSGGGGAGAPRLCSPSRSQDRGSGARDSRSPAPGMAFGTVMGPTLYNIQLRAPVGWGGLPRRYEPG